MRAARRAGINTAAAAAPSMHTATPTSVAGSEGRISKSVLASTVVAAIAAHRPTANPTRTGSLPGHEAQDIPAAGAERHPNTDLFRSLGYRERQHAIHADE